MKMFNIYLYQPDANLDPDPDGLVEATASLRASV
jgi:hypothetical protein